MDFLETFTSGMYHIDMRILKILASNSERLVVYSIFKKWQIDDDDDDDDDDRGGGQILHFVR